MSQFLFCPSFPFDQGSLKGLKVKTTKVNDNYNTSLLYCLSIHGSSLFLVTPQNCVAVCAGLFKVLNTFSCTFMRQNSCIFLAHIQSFYDSGLTLHLLPTFQSKFYPTPHDITITICILSFSTNECYTLIKIWQYKVFIAEITNIQKMNCKYWLDEL